MTEFTHPVRILKADGILIFPTETVYGVGCKLSSLKGIEKLYKIRGRKPSKPTSIVVADFEMAKKYALFGGNTERLARAFWPGPLTLVLPATTLVPKQVQAGTGTVGLRVPGHSWLLNLLKALGEPILAPSANFAGGQAPKRLNQIDSKLAGLVDYVVDVESGGQKPSTVLDLSNGSLTFLREGSISLKQIELALGEQNLG